MKARREYLKNDYPLADTDTTLIDLKFADALSSLMITITAQNGATSCVDHRIDQDVPVIEVVDGSEVITSLSMSEWIAQNFYNTKNMPPATLTELGGAVQSQTVIIPFGRLLNDPEMYLDTRKYSNPQLRIQNQFTIDASAGFATGTGRLTVIANLMASGYGAQKGFIGCKEIKSFTADTSGDAEVQLPRKQLMRRIYLSALLSTYKPQEVLTKYKLDIDTGKDVPFDIYADDYAEVMKAKYGLAEEIKHIYVRDDNERYTNIYDIREAHLRANVPDHIAVIESVDAEKISVGLYDMTNPSTPAAETSSKDCVLHVKGLSPYATCVFDFGKADDPGTWANFANNESAILYLTQAQAGAVKVWIERLMI